MNLPKVTLGTMMWGDQVSEPEAQTQMKCALDHDITHWDTAEMYTVPPKAETYGKTEEFIGNFLRQNPVVKSKVKIFTKCAARGVRHIDYIREGNHFANKKNIEQAINGSLYRLGVEQIELYQVHWPDRVVPVFGQRNYQHQPNPQCTSIEETAQALLDMVNTGKIKNVGVSNETPWDS